MTMKAGSIIAKTPRLLARFRSELLLSKQGCLEWQGALFWDGYGRYRFGWRGSAISVRAHRIAWELAHGPIPSGLVICHRCDNRRCCTVEHLFLGTQKDNIRDCLNKGRANEGDRAYQAKLSAARVQWIREMYAEAAAENRPVRLSRLASIFRVSRMNFWRAGHGRQWRRTA